MGHQALQEFSLLRTLGAHRRAHHHSLWEKVEQQCINIVSADPTPQHANALALLTLSWASILLSVRTSQNNPGVERANEGAGYQFNVFFLRSKLNMKTQGGGYWIQFTSHS